MLIKLDIICWRLFIGTRNINCSVI